MLSGVILVLLGAAGMFVLGPTAEMSKFGSTFYLDEAENIAHLVLGAVALGAYFTIKSERLLKALVVLVGIIAAIATAWGLISMGKPFPNIGVSNLENPADNVLHGVVALWAFFVAFRKSAK
jgi:hypothetical protein